MRVFSHDQSERFYLSPYVKIMIRNDGLAVHNTVFDSTLVLKCPDTTSRRLIGELSKGITKDKLLLALEPLSNGAGKRMLDSWIRVGVIE